MHKVHSFNPDSVAAKSTVESAPYSYEFSYATSVGSAVYFKYTVTTGTKMLFVDEYEGVSSVVCKAAGAGSDADYEVVITLDDSSDLELLLAGLRSRDNVGGYLNADDVNCGNGAFAGKVLSITPESATSVRVTLAKVDFTDAFESLEFSLFSGNSLNFDAAEQDGVTMKVRDSR